MPSSNSRFRIPKEPGLLKKHLMGDYSLARAYWLHNVLLGWLVTFTAAYAIYVVGERYAVRYVSMTVLALEAALLLVWLWATVGTWMSAAKHFFGGGSRFWAIAAMLSVSAGALAMVHEAPNLRPLLVEHWELALGAQPAEAFTVTLSGDGRIADFKGGINEGAAEALESLLASAQTVATVRLDSPGGWLREGDRMAGVVKKHGISTHVDAKCFSSCTLVLLAGVNRSAGPRAEIGFHRGRDVGEVEGQRLEPGVGEAALYLKAGLDPAFVRRILATRNKDIWIPARSELVQAHVLTR